MNVELRQESVERIKPKADLFGTCGIAASAVGIRKIRYCEARRILEAETLPAEYRSRLGDGQGAHSISACRPVAVRICSGYTGRFWC